MIYYIKWLQNEIEIREGYYKEEDIQLIIKREMGEENIQKVRFPDYELPVLLKEIKSV